MIDLRNSINVKEIPVTDNPKIVVNIVEKILDFNKQQKDKGRPSDLTWVIGVAKVSDCKVSGRKRIRILVFKQML